MVMLQDIIDEWDIENNFEYVFNKYILYLDYDGKFKHSAPRAKINFKARLKKLHNEGECEGREYIKFKNWVQKQMYRDQKQAERFASKLGWEEKYKKVLQENEILKKQIKELEEKHQKLLNRYLDECDSDSD